MGERVLLVSLDNLGDLVFASSLVRPLRERGSEVALFCKDYAAPVAALIPGLKDVFAADPFWDKSPGRAKGGFFAFAAALGRARRAGFDSAIVTSRSWRPRLCARLCGIRKISFQSWPADAARPVLEDLAPLLGEYGGPAVLRCELGLKPSATGASGRLAVLHAFAGDARRCLPLPVWDGIASALRADGWKILWIAAPAEAARLKKTERDAVVSGLAEAAAALAQAALFIGHDSGPLHLANALGAPCVGLYLPGEPRRTFPQGVGRFVLIERGSPDGLGAGEVLAAARRLGEAGPSVK